MLSQTQRYVRYGHVGLLVCSSTRLEDVPAAETFLVEDAISVSKYGKGNIMNMFHSPTPFLPTISPIHPSIHIFMYLCLNSTLLLSHSYSLVSIIMAGKSRWSRCQSGDIFRGDSEISQFLYSFRFSLLSL